MGADFDEGRLSLVLRRWSVFGIPLPLWLCPRASAYEGVENGRFHFHVEIGHPLIGLIVRYQGWLLPSSNIALGEPSRKMKAPAQPS